MYPTSTPLLDIQHLNKVFTTSGHSVHALQNINLGIKEGEFITVIGPSGCGKSTLLRIIAGLDTDYTGKLSLAGQPVLGPGIDKGFIFQEPRLFPWLTVEKTSLPTSRCMIQIFVVRSMN